MIVLIPVLEISPARPTGNYEDPVFQTKMHQAPIILS